MKESRVLEYKEKVSNTFLKTVSAYANYGTGEIVFGIADDGTIIGVNNIADVCLDIENRINDSINPVPMYTLNVNEKLATIHLIVEEGLHKPYLYKSKAYRRNNTATIEIDHFELTRLILEGQNISFEELMSEYQNPTFTVLQSKINETMHLDSFTEDTLKTLELCGENSGINKAGELLADENSFCGIDIVRFGDSINVILDRATYEHQSILLLYDRSVEMYRKYYQFDKIQGMTRETVSVIPEEAFREAVANAIVHRTWDVKSNINIAMHADRIEITSPGGLPQGMYEDEYLRGGISIPRNRIIANIFLRLKLIERFGTGIRRIQEAYYDNPIKPQFELGENSIKITLPVLMGSNTLSSDENEVLRLCEGRIISSSEVVESTGFGKSKVVSILNKLVDAGYIKVIGNGRGTRYTTA